VTEHPRRRGGALSRGSRRGRPSHGRGRLRDDRWPRGACDAEFRVRLEALEWALAPPRLGTTGPAWRCRAADVALDRLLAPQEHAARLRAVDARIILSLPLSSAGR
jgi:hypothetical protein